MASSMPLVSRQELSNVKMCKETQKNHEALSDDNRSHVSNMNLQDSDQSSVCCDNLSHTEADKSDAELSDDDKQELTGNKKRTCDICEEIFHEPAEYTLHLKKHTRGTECLVCGKTLSSPNSLDRHLLVHSGDKPFSCPDCGKAFTTNGNMRRHMRKRKHSSKNSSKKARKIVADDEVSLPETTHSIVAGGSTKCNVSIPVPRFVDLNCDVTSAKWDLLAGMDCENRRTGPHKTDQQTDEQCQDCGSVCLKMSCQGDKKEFLVCKVCKSGFLSRREFQIHELSHLSPSKINFSERKEEDKDDFLKSIRLMRAEKTDSRNNFFRDVLSWQAAPKGPGASHSSVIPDPHAYGDNSAACAKEVVSLNSEAVPGIGSPYSPDRASPNGTQGPTSPVDEYAARNQGVIDSELQCKECAECFKTKKFLKIHQFQIHLQKSTFECKQCNYVSTDKSTLNRHTRIHTGERPYMCDHCSRKFTTETNAKRHVKQKHNIVDKIKKHITCITNDKSSNTNENTKCPYCKNDFGDSKILTQHKNSPECPGKPYICSECPMRFPTKNNCLRHMKNQHEMDKDTAKQLMIISKLDTQDESESSQRQQKIEEILDAATDAALTGSNSPSLTDKPNDDVNVVKYPKDFLKELQSTDGSCDTVLDFSLHEGRNIKSGDQEFPLNSDNVCQRPSSVEVAVSYSMLRLSEYQKEQEEVLDLSMRPIDLSFKRDIPTLELQLNTTEKTPRYPSELQIPPAHAPFLTKNCSIRDSLHKGFTSQPGILDYTRNLCTPKFYKQVLLAPNSANSFASESMDSEDYEQNLVIAEDAVSPNTRNENGATQATSVKPCPSDDLASVSSVIDTANSQDISKFLNPATFTRASKTEFFISSNPKSHRLRNTVDSKRFPCLMCDSSFDTSSTLNRHLVTHTGEKKFKCSICSKGFGTKSNCKRHENTHLTRSSQKPRVSPNESQNSSDASNTADSMEVSTAYQPEIYSHRTEASMSSLYRNFDAKPSPVPCLVTDFSRQNLDCKFCKTAYKSKQDLINHTKELHPLEYIGAGFH